MLLGATVGFKFEERDGTPCQGVPGCLVSALAFNRKVLQAVQKTVTHATPARTYLDFEKHIGDLENKVAELRQLEGGESVPIVEEIRKLEQKAKGALVETYSKLTPWQKTLVARHADRPHTMEFIDRLIEDFTPLAGDRYFAEDEAIMGGMGRFRGRSVMVIGIASPLHQCFIC